jgi:hypothetical protein
VISSVTPGLALSVGDMDARERRAPVPSGDAPGSGGADGTSGSSLTSRRCRDGNVLAGVAAESPMRGMVPDWADSGEDTPSGLKPSNDPDTSRYVHRSAGRVPCALHQASATVGTATAAAGKPANHRDPSLPTDTTTPYGCAPDRRVLPPEYTTVHATTAAAARRDWALGPLRGLPKLVTGGSTPVARPPLAHELRRRSSVERTSCPSGPDGGASPAREVEVRGESSEYCTERGKPDQHSRRSPSEVEDLARRPTCARCGTSRLPGSFLGHTQLSRSPRRMTG